MQIFGYCSKYCTKYVIIYNTGGSLNTMLIQLYMGLDVTKPVFGVSDKVRLKPVETR